MLYWLLFEKLFPHFGPARLFGFITFRTAFASLSALFISIIALPNVNPVAKFTPLPV